MQLIKNDGRTVLREETVQTADGSHLLLLKFPLLDETGCVTHCFTTRLGGVSKGIFSTLNLSFDRGDDAEAVRENYRRVAHALGTDETAIVRSGQKHTTNIKRVTHADAGLLREPAGGYPDDADGVDGLITDEPGLLLATFYADCVPLYFVDTVHRAIGLSHSGWRGTASGMGAVTVRAMTEAFGTGPEDLYCAVGPSICGDCYEVGSDVAEVFFHTFPDWADEIIKKRRDVPGKYLLNLWRANEKILLAAGVKKEHLAVTNICTRQNPEILFSHRASNGKRGNMGAFLMLNRPAEM